jgi:hypothetical protein
MNIYFEYIFRKENLSNIIGFPFSIHLQKKDLEIITCQKKNSKFYFKVWDLKNHENALPSFKEIETDNFVDYCYNNFDKNEVVNFSKILFNRTSCSNNVTLNEDAFNYYYKNLLINNIEEFKYFKRNQLFYFLFKEQYESNRSLNIHSASKIINKKDLAKWKLWEKYMINNMFPGEFIFHR